MRKKILLLYVECVDISVCHPYSVTFLLLHLSPAKQVFDSFHYCVAVVTVVTVTVSPPDRLRCYLHFIVSVLVLCTMTIKLTQI